MHIYNKFVIIIGFGIFYYGDSKSIGSFFSQMGRYLGNLFGFTGNGFLRVDELTVGTYNKVLNETVYFTIVSFPILPKIKSFLEKKSVAVRSAAEIVSGVLCVGLLILSTILLIASKNNPFLYFRF